MTCKYLKLSLPATSLTTVFTPVLSICKTIESVWAFRSINNGFSGNKPVPLILTFAYCTLAVPSVSVPR